MIDLRAFPVELALARKAIANNARKAARDGGVGIMRQILDLATLRLGPGKLSADDYYALRVYRREFSQQEKGRFMSSYALPAMIVGGWRIVARDKLLTNSILRDQGAEIAEIHAICHPIRTYRRLRTLKNALDIRRYLESTATFPFIAKPIMGSHSRNVTLVTGYDATSCAVRTADGSSLSVADFAGACMGEKDGVLFQQVLVPHADIAREFGPQLCTLRLMILLDGSGASLFNAIWKIAVGDHVADNYWRRGNLLAKLDLETGRIERCTAGSGADLRFVDLHPDTGRPLKGFSLPCYREAVDLALRLSLAFPGLPYQSWDIALTPSGPVPLEINAEGSLLLPQIVDQKGVRRDAFQAFHARFVR